MEAITNIPKEESQKKEVMSSSNDLLKVVERLEKANAEHRELVLRQEEMIAKNLLGGLSEAGSKQEPPKVETPIEYTRRIMSGKR